LGKPFRMLRMKGEGFEGVKWVPGQAIQIFLGNLTKRAYTPMDLDPGAGSACFLIHLHGNGPGSAWAASVKAGDICQVMRPKNSIDFPSIGEPAFFFGDETSLAAAQALHRCEGQLAKSHFVLEVNSHAEVEAVLDKLGLRNRTLIQKSEDGSHLARVVSTLAEQASIMQAPQWVFTGTGTLDSECSEGSEPSWSTAFNEQSEGLLVSRKNRHGLITGDVAPGQGTLFVGNLAAGAESNSFIACHAVLSAAGI
jgi:ferric-chelate reductase (NADPH)